MTTNYSANGPEGSSSGGLDQAMTEALPLLTASVPGTGGRLRVEPEDFVVDEIPSYEPAGEGEHLFLRIEKRQRATDDVRRQLAKMLRIRQDDIGVAGLKDKHAVTRQWMSVPARALTEERALSLSLERVQVLEAKLHRNKLRTGHLKGNRFEIRIRDASPDAVTRASACAEQVGRLGVPNYYGEQRFGREGETVGIGLAILSGQSEFRGRPLGRIDRSLRRLALSAVQSSLFNRLLAQRMELGLLHQVELGDVMQVVASGGVFVAEDLAREQPRLSEHETAITGPMFGPKMVPAVGAPGEREDALLEASGLAIWHFAKQGKLVLGTRRPYLIRPTMLEVEGAGSDVWVRFSLPAGAYATVVMREMMEPSQP